MKLFILLLLLCTSAIKAQNVVFDASGRAVFKREYPGKTADEIYKGVYSFITSYYGYHEERMQADSITKTLHLQKGEILDVLCRKYFSGKKPEVIGAFEMRVQITDGKIDGYIQHLNFHIYGLDYYIDFKKLQSGEPDPLIFENEYENYCNQFTAFLNCMSRAITTGILKYEFGINLNKALYSQQPLQLNEQGIATAILTFEKDESTLQYLVDSFLHKHYFMGIPVIEQPEPNAKTIVVEGGLFDVFNNRSSHKTNRNPIINASNIITIKVDGNTVSLTIQHKDFIDDNDKIISATFSDALHSKNYFKGTTAEQKQYLIKNYNTFLSSLKYYIDKGEMGQ
ncbi:hypothetical protein AM493_08190 [Flavobacterium akiainvivens]|uniref:DUF4468 domain-containing protein n=1 Tax=Flavobacterium akiainvivens TaxID=1202724 RepID=A0A0M8MI34_9FLAO|nr:hypothetical protein [Flavobacterium akiainvivens]KOS06018.1 hypothetical protein AM493_08190 [Flavobacterium akiainvivens]SFQ54273.1 hypothetical protein SAMN05444144_107120 [Flavobacterium akiainvivens]